MNERTKKQRIATAIQQTAMRPTERTEETYFSIRVRMCDAWCVRVLQWVRLGHFYYLHVINAKKTD